MLITYQKCHIAPKLGTDMKGQPSYGPTRVEGCTVITFRLEDKHTSIRADTSGSQARASMLRASVRVLLKPHSKAAFGAKVTFVDRPGERYRVVEMLPRYDAAGRLHHYQCDLEKL